MNRLQRSVRPLIIFVGLLLIWYAVTLTGIPSYMLPTPFAVAKALWSGRESLSHHFLVTLSEIALGLLCGLALGMVLALTMMFSPRLQQWLMPVLIISQAIPVFALAPLLVLWLGFGMASKIVMATLIIFFPVTASFFDGLRRTEPGWLELAKTMNADGLAELRHVRLMAALPSFGSGLRVAAAVAPIGAIIGEWVGSSSGLGYVMLNANARVQTEVCFAALFLLALMAVVLVQLVDISVRKLLYWVPDSSNTH
jgi:putative hydroxymethylpyrimidine transport system permease protein